jgi:hypothetical protein
MHFKFDISVAVWYDFLSYIIYSSKKFAFSYVMIVFIFVQNCSSKSSSSSLIGYQWMIPRPPNKSVIFIIFGLVFEFRFLGTNCLHHDYADVIIAGWILDGFREHFQLQLVILLKLIKTLYKIWLKSIA